MKGMNRSENDQHTGDAALEFIKHVCAVLALDQNVQHDILVKTCFKYLAIITHLPNLVPVYALADRILWYAYDTNAVHCKFYYMQRYSLIWGLIEWFML